MYIKHVKISEEMTIREKKQLNLGAAIFLKKRTISNNLMRYYLYSEAGQAAENANETQGPGGFPLK
jgi:hypothetical protein